jgi:hypothetical protein
MDAAPQDGEDRREGGVPEGNPDHSPGRTGDEPAARDRAAEGGLEPADPQLDGVDRGPGEAEGPPSPEGARSEELPEEKRGEGVRADPLRADLDQLDPVEDHERREEHQRKQPGQPAPMGRGARRGETLREKQADQERQRKHAAEKRGGRDEPKRDLGRRSGAHGPIRRINRSVMSS